MREGRAGLTDHDIENPGFHPSYLENLGGFQTFPSMMLLWTRLL
jgi:hypothetical protein